MKHTMTVNGVFGQWRLTVELEPGDDQTISMPIDERQQRIAMSRFKSLEPHFFDVVNLAEIREIRETTDPPRPER